MSKKEQKQVIMLGALVVIITATVLYMNRGKLVPRAASAPSYARIPRQQLPSDTAFDSLFGRPDFKALLPFGDVPVKPGEAGTADPFAPLEE